MSALNVCGTNMLEDRGTRSQVEHLGLGRRRHTCDIPVHERNLQMATFGEQPGGALPYVRAVLQLRHLLNEPDWVPGVLDRVRTPVHGPKASTEHRALAVGQPEPLRNGYRRHRAPHVDRCLTRLAALRPYLTGEGVRLTAQPVGRLGPRSVVHEDRAVPDDSSSAAALLHVNESLAGEHFQRIAHGDPGDPIAVAQLGDGREAVPRRVHAVDDPRPQLVDDP